MKKTLYIIVALFITSVAFANVVENVLVDTSQAPSNYVVSYDLNTTGDWYYVEAVLSDNDGVDYQFAIGESRNPDRNKSPNFPAVFAPFDNEYTINTYLNTSSNYFFSFKIGRPLSIQNAKLKIIATKAKPIGKLWKEITTAAPWNGRNGHQSVVFDNKIWVIGGGYKNDVWSSPDGTNWIKVTAIAPRSVSLGHQSVVLDNKIWIIGGTDNNSAIKNDVMEQTGQKLLHQHLGVFALVIKA